jgi:hypothetical protein
MPALRLALSILGLGLLVVPAFAQAPTSVKYECEDPTGFEVLAWITLTGTHYGLTSQMQVSGEGELSLQDDGAGIVVLSGPLAKDFGLLGAKPASGPKLTFVDERGPVMICRQQQG